MKGLSLRKSCSASDKGEHWRHHVEVGLPSEGPQQGAMWFRRVHRQGVCCHSILFFLSKTSLCSETCTSMSLNFFYLFPLHGCHAEIVQKFL